MTEYDVFINAAGSTPDSSFLMNSCLKTDSGFINCDENFQTANSNIYAIGDVSVSNNLNNQHWAYAQVEIHCNRCQCNHKTLEALITVQRYL